MAVPSPPLPGAVGFMDDSSGTGCMTSNPKPLVYRSDRVVLRTALSAPAARNLVAQALQDVHASAQISMDSILDATDPFLTRRP